MKHTYTQAYLERERPNNRDYSNVMPGSVLITLSDGASITDLANNSSDDRTSGLFRDGLLFGESFESFDRLRDFEDEERRKRADDDLIGEVYYIFDPRTNLYSSYRVFGPPSWLEPVDPSLPVGITGAGGTIGATGPIEGSPDL